PMSQWGGRVSRVRQTTLSAATPLTSTPSSTGTGSHRANAPMRRRARARAGGAPSTRVTSVATASLRGLGSAQAQDREQERREEHLDAHDHERGGENRHLLLGEAAQAVCEPPADDNAAERQARDRQAGAEQQA